MTKYQIIQAARDAWGELGATLQEEPLLRFAAAIRAATKEEDASMAENYDLGTPEGHAIAAAIRSGK